MPIKASLNSNTDETLMRTSSLLNMTNSKITANSNPSLNGSITNLAHNQTGANSNNSSNQSIKNQFARFDGGEQQIVVSRKKK